MINQIIGAVCSVMCVPPTLIKDRCRTKQVALARQIAMYYTNRCGLGVQRTGEAFKRHHSNISYATKCIRELRECDHEVREICLKVEEALPQLINGDNDYQI